MAKEIACPACHSLSRQALESVDVAEQHVFYAPADEPAQRTLTEAAVASALDYQMFRCNQCGLEFCSPLKAPTSNWYAIAYPLLERSQGEHQSHRWEFDEVIRHLRPGQSLFEIGCGPGDFLDQCRASGIEAQGLDFMDEAVRRCHERGLKVRHERLGDAPLTSVADHFDHICAFQVIEHLENPAMLFESASRLAGRRCDLWLSVPSNLRSSRRFGQKDFLDQPPHHMSRWTPDAFSALGSKAGWKLAEMIYEPIALRTAVWLISTASAAYNRKKSAGRLAPPWRERAFRAALLPYALAKRVTTERQMSGFSMIAHFVRTDSAR
jgi:hypothetical protein